MILMASSLYQLLFLLISVGVTTAGIVDITVEPPNKGWTRRWDQSVVHCIYREVFTLQKLKMQLLRHQSLSIIWRLFLLFEVRFCCKYDVQLYGSQCRYNTWNMIVQGQCILQLVTAGGQYRTYSKVIDTVKQGPKRISPQVIPLKSVQPLSSQLARKQLDPLSRGSTVNGLAVENSGAT